jgi:hypothetical protein
MLTINYWAVLVSAISAIWYSKKVFGAIWQRESGVVCSDKKGHGAMVFGVSFIFSLITAFAFAFLLGTPTFLIPSLITGVGVGVCFVGTSLGINYLFANRSIKLLLIDAGYHIVQFTLYGLILGLWH